MHLLGRVFLTLLIWLTAIMTLVAGTPHFLCVCPDGRVKSYCLGPTQTTGCCGGDCCGKASRQRGASNDQRTTCCGHRSTCGATPQPKNTGLLVSNGCCTKYPAQTVPAILSSSDTRVVGDVVFPLLLAPEVSLNQHSFAAIGRDRQERECPPPTDLILALQHLLI